MSMGIATCAASLFPHFFVGFVCGKLAKRVNRKNE
jgi:hypothetical protein